VVAGFRPRIGIEQVGAAEARVRQFYQQLQRVVGVEADVGEARLIDGLHQLGDAAGKDFAADEAGAGRRGGLAGEMFAAAVADLDDAARRLGEQRIEIERGIAELDLQRGQDVAVERVLPAVQALAGAAAEEGARLAGGIQRVVGPGQAQAALTAAFSDDTRSIFSQLKEPSRPGLRPKWP
jgi:hypothetical protein